MGHRDWLGAIEAFNSNSRNSVFDIISVYLLHNPSIPDDPMLANAVLSAPAFLSGLTDWRRPCAKLRLRTKIASLGGLENSPTGPRHCIRGFFIQTRRQVAPTKDSLVAVRAAEARAGRCCPFLYRTASVTISANWGPNSGTGSRYVSTFLQRTLTILTVTAEVVELADG